MKRRKVPQLLLFLSLLSVPAVSTTQAFFFRKADQVLPKTAHIGDTISVPSYTIKKDGKEVTADDCVIQTPSGISYRSKEIKVEESGVYTLIYSGLIDQKRVQEKVTFTSLINAENLFESDGASTFKKGTFPGKVQGQESYSGMELCFSKDSKIRFKKAIDFSSLTSSDTLLDFLVLPSKEGSVDFSTLYFTFTDANDPTNELTIRFTDGSEMGSADGRVGYCSVKGGNQLTGGYESFATNNPYHLGDNYGAPLEMSFKGLSTSVQEKKPYYPCRLFLDYASKSLRASPSYSSKQDTFINDLDDPAVYPSTSWKGFKSGKAYLTISAGGILTSDAKIVLHSLLGYDFTQDDIQDTKAPVFTLDYQGENPNYLPFALKDHTYPLFPYSVFDDYSDDFKVDTYVRYRLASGKMVDMPYEDSSFLTPYPGVYQVEYVTEDAFKNQGKISYEVFCYSSQDSLEIELPIDTDSHEVYSLVSLPDLSTLTVKGGSGKKTLKREIRTPKGEVIEEDNNTFLPKVAGEYTLVYTAYDFVGNTTKKEVKLTVNQISSPKFLSAPSFPDTLIQGLSYPLPMPNSVYPDGLETKEGKATIKIDGREVTSDTYTPTMAGKHTIDFIPGKQKEEKGKVSFSFEVRNAASEDSLDKKAYFTGATGQDHASGMLFSVSDDKPIHFLSPLSSQSPSFYFALSKKEMDSSSGFYLTLADALGLGKTLTIRITTENGKHVLYYPGVKNGFTFDTTNSKINADNDAYSIPLSYDTYRQGFLDGTGMSLGKAVQFDDGSAFTGFSDTVYLSFGIRSPKTSVPFSLYRINNQIFSSSSKGDTAGPQIILDKDFDTIQELGSTFLVSKAKAVDVLSGIDASQFVVSLKDPSGKDLLKNEDASKDHSITLSTPGAYSLTYSAVDKADIFARLTRSILVQDKIAPTVEIKEEPKKEYTLGDTLTIPEYDFSANGKNVKLDVYLILPNNFAAILVHEEKNIVPSLDKKVSYLDTEHYSASFVVDENTVRLNQTGNYRLRFHIRDSYSNSTIKDYAFVVKEGAK